MKTLLVSPQAGMCNRFRVLCCAILLAHLSGRKLYHCWEEEAPHAVDQDIIRDMRRSSWTTFFVEDCAIPFRAVDATTPVDQVFSEWGPDEYWYSRQSSAIRRCGWDGQIHVERSRSDAILESEADTVLLETSLGLKPSSLTDREFERALRDIYAKHFKPHPRFLEVAESFASGGPYVGIHIRRTDHLRYVRAANIRTKTWQTMIRQRVDPDEALYICSDDQRFADAVTALLPEYRRLGVDQTFAHTPKFQAFLEFLCLSKAARIYGTVGSSFSREAARFGDVPFVLCSAERSDFVLKRAWDFLGLGKQQMVCQELPPPPLFYSLILIP